MTPPAEALHLLLEPDPLFAMYHPATEPRQPVAVLLCPPFGWDEMNSHRARRAWAQHLAADGIATLRIDLPGTGDSGGGASDPDRLAAWTDAVSASAAWLAERSGCERIAAIGIGAGGVAACRALLGGAPLDDLVLWGVPAAGRDLVREMRAFARLEASRLADQDAPAPPPLPPGALAAAGYVLSGETRRELEAVDLTADAGGGAAGARVLLLGRDGLAADEALAGALRDAGAEVEVAPGDGYGEMVLGDMLAFRMPAGTFAGVSRWLRAGGTPRAHEWPAPPVATGDGVKLLVDGTVIRERPVTLRVAGGELPGVLAEPDGPAAQLCGVLLNAGSQRRTGPSRMWVQTARRWAAAGVPTVRFDVAGIGDAPGISLGWGDAGAFYDGRHAAQVAGALDALADHGLPPRFLLLGLCSGANWAFHAALEDDRVAAAVLLNPATLFWNRWTSLSRGGRQVRRLAVTTTLHRVRARELGPHEALRALVAAAIPGRVVARWTALRGRLAGHRPIRRLHAALDRLEARGCRLDVVFTDREPLRDELETRGSLEVLAARAGVELELIASGAETHTMQPLWIQARAQELADRALARELDRTGPAAVPSPTAG